MMLYTKYQGCRPCGFPTGDFFVFPIEACVKHATPGERPFLAAGSYFEHIGSKSKSRCCIPNIKVLSLVVSDDKMALWFQMAKFSSFDF